jgi:hypothetical protein
MSDSDFHTLVMGHPIQEPPKTVTFSCRLDVEIYADIAAISEYFGSSKTFVAQTFLKAALADFFKNLDPKNCGAIQAASESYAESLLEGK